MRTNMRIHDGYFHAFYEDPFLLIQLLLVEFVHVHQVINQIQEYSTPGFHSEELPEPLFSSLITSLKQLIGNAPTHYQFFSFFHWSKGSLFKLKEYSKLLVRHAENEHRPLFLLHRIINQTWTIANQSLELLHKMEELIAPLKHNTDLILQLKNTLKKLFSCFNQVIRKVPSIIEAYRNNENVMLCLLRQKDALQQIYGHVFYKKFKWLSTDQLKNFLHQRYHARGFNSLLPSVQQVFIAHESR